MDHPVVADRGAVASLRKLINQINPAAEFTIKQDIDDRLAPHIQRIAASHGWDPKPARMTFDQQKQVLSELDRDVYDHDYQLWRTKQLNDFSNGVWAQIYGPSYNLVIRPLLWTHTTCRILTPLLLALIALLLYRRRRTALVCRGQSV
jgi:hypothetical protein